MLNHLFKYVEFSIKDFHLSTIHINFMLLVNIVLIIIV